MSQRDRRRPLSNRKAYSVRGTEANVNKAIDEWEKTNREEIVANKECELQEWEVEMKKADNELKKELKQIEAESEKALKQIQAELDVEMKKVDQGLQGDEKYKLASETIGANKILWIKKMESEHEERMKALENEKLALDRKTDVALSAISRSKGRFSMDRTFLQPIEHSSSSKTRRSKHNLPAINFRQEPDTENLDKLNIEEVTSDIEENNPGDDLCGGLTFDTSSTLSMEMAKTQGEQILKQADLESKEADIEKLQLEIQKLQLTKQK